MKGMFSFFFVCVCTASENSINFVRTFVPGILMKMKCNMSVQQEGDGKLIA